MPVSTIYEIPRLNMTFTEDALEEVSSQTDHYEDSYYYIERLEYRPPPQVAYRFVFNNGSVLTHRAGADSEIIITRKVDLVEGKMYQMGKDGKKWLALCRYDDKFGELTLFPTTRRKYAPLVRESDRMDYNFYKEFDHDYKEHL